MVIDMGDEKEDMIKGTKRKAQPMQDAISTDDDEVKTSTDDTGMVNDLIASNREAEERANDLVAELNATKASLRLLAQSKNIDPAELDDYLLAAEIMQEQLDEANGEQLETGPSGSGTHPQPVLRTVKKKAPTAVSGAKPATKPAVKPATKSDHIPKLPVAKP